MRTVQIKTYVTQEEKAEVAALARQARLSVSELARRLITGRRLPEAQHHEDVLALIKINGDLARLGNLLRMALNEEDFQPPGNMNLETLFKDIRHTQTLLKAAIKELGR